MTNEIRKVVGISIDEAVTARGDDRIFSLKLANTEISGTSLKETIG
jgi:hypothetical protein